MTDALLSLTGVSKRYPGADGRFALDQVSLTVAPGETVGLVGESGSGKSTLARLSLGLLGPTHGAVRFAGHDPYRLRGRSGRPVRARLQFVPQHPRASLNPALRAGEAVAFALRTHGAPRRERPELTAELFRQVGLDPALARRYPRELSGGQLQRVAVARALATGPELVVCDEPTSALDRRVQARILDLFTELQERRGLAYLFISHDLAVVRRLAHRVVVLRHGRVVEEGPAEALWTAPRHPYTRALLAAATGTGPAGAGSSATGSGRSVPKDRAAIPPKPSTAEPHQPHPVVPDRQPFLGNHMTHRQPHHRFRARAAALLSATALLLTAAGCAPGSTAGSGTKTSGRGGTLVIGATGKLPNTDTMIGGAGFEGKRLVSFQLYEGLTRYDLSRTDAPPSVTGALATSWKVAADHKTWTFTLREGVKFQDGTPFNADAVLFNLDRYLDKKSEYYTDALGAAAGEYAGGITSYRELADGQVELVTKTPNGHFPEDLAHVLIASPAAVRATGSADFSEHPVGTGPFSFASQRAGEQIDLVANRSYWRGAPKLDKLVIKALPDAAARTAALRSGSVNWIEYPNPDDIETLKADGAQVVTNNYDHLWYWILDTKKGPWKELKVRQAANYAINREAIADKLLHGTADPAYQAAPRATLAYDKAGDTYAYDPAKAKRLLAEAGYADGFSTSVTVPTGGSGNLLPVPITEALQRDLAAVGIKAEIRTTDWSTLISAEAKGSVALGSDAIAQSTTLFQSEALLPLFIGTGSPFWTGQYSNPEVDALLASAAASPDQKARQADYRQALSLVTKDAPWLFVVNDRNPRALAPTVHGLVQPQSWFLDLTTVRVGE